jgi:hypothetical protein
MLELRLEHVWAGLGWVFCARPNLLTSSAFDTHQNYAWPLILDLLQASSSLLSEFYTAMPPEIFDQRLLVDSQLLHSHGAAFI